MDPKKCPICGKNPDDYTEHSESEQDLYCSCNVLYCPTCDQPVDWFGESPECNPCEHVIAWGTIGSEEIVWEDAKLERLFDKFLSSHEDDYLNCEEALEAYAEKKHLDFQKHDNDDQGSFIVFRSPTHK